MKLAFEIYKYTTASYINAEGSLYSEHWSFFLSKNKFFNTVLKKLTIIIKHKRFVPFQKAVMLLIFEDQVSEGLHF